MALPAWEPQGTPSRALWEATNRICGRFLGSVLFLLDCAGCLCFFMEMTRDCMRHDQVCVTLDCLGKEKEFGIMGKSLKGN